MTRVTIKAVRKHKLSDRLIWLVIDFMQNKLLSSEKSRTEAIHTVEENGWILEPNAVYGQYDVPRYAGK